jgi:hypothetical protein
MASTINTNAITGMTTPLGTTITQTWLESTHSEQNNYNNYCGDIEYVLTSGANSAFITKDDATKVITVSSTNATYVRNNHVCLRSRL